jgi:hypothetical protein
MDKTRNSQSGLALLMALFFVSICLVLLSGIAVRLVNQGNHVGQYVENKDCFQGLEAAYAQAKSEIEAGEDGNVGLENWTLPQGGFTPPQFGDSTVVPLHLAALPDVEYYAVTQPWDSDGLDNDGNGIVDDPEENWIYTIYGFARNGIFERQMEAVVAGNDVNVWRNAIFAGAGQAGGVINGNVSIHGSVHILGEHVAEGMPALAALDLSGASLIHNNYDGLPAYLADRVPTLPQRSWNGEMVETLDAVLRVKNGLVGMSGSSEIGSPDTAGNTFKETMDGTFVADGWTGNAVTDDGDRGDPQQLYSDNGWDETYDLGELVQLPIFADDWRDPDTGERVPDPDTGTWYTHQDYFNEVLVADPLIENDGIYNGDIDIFTRGDHFYWNATTGEELNGSLPAAAPGANDDYILFNADADVLQVNGQVTVNGNFTLRGQGNQTTIHYSGRAALLVNGNVQLDTSLLTCNNGNPADTALSFPQNNILGLMASQDMIVGSVAQVDLMGAFYAQNRITSAKQSTIMGTFVSGYFDMGTNVPDIYQVPALADNLPRGMIGNYPILAMTQIAWREPGGEL